MVKKMKQVEISSQREDGVVVRLARCVQCDLGSVHPLIVSVFADQSVPLCGRCKQPMTVIREVQVDQERTLLGIDSIDGRTIHGI